jgi:hypothetical protein
MPNTNNNVQRSEVARLLDQIREEYEAVMRGISGTAQGTSRHSFITARMENMGALNEELGMLVGPDSMALVVQMMDQCQFSEATPPQ